MIATVRKIFSLFTPQDRRSLWILVSVLIITAVTETLGVASILPFMAIITRPEIITGGGMLTALYDGLGFQSDASFLVAIGVATLLALLVTNTLSAVANWMVFRFTYLQAHKLSTRLLSSYLGQPYAYFLERNSSVLSKNVIAEVKRVNVGVMLPALQVMAKLVVTLLMVAMLLAFDPLLALSIASVVSVAYAAIYLAVRRQLKIRGREATVASEECHRLASESFSGIKDIKISGREGEFVRRFFSPSLQMARNFAAADAVSLLPKHVLETIAFGGILVVALYVLTRNEPGSVIPTMTLYAFAGYRLMPALQQIYSGLTVIRYNTSALDIVCADLRDRESEQWDSLADPVPFKREISIENLGFSYADGEPILRNASIKIARNTTVAITGQSGAGKTTLIDILMGLLEPTSGRMLVDGIVVEESNVRGWQRNIGYVPQQIYLSDDSIAANIAFGVSADSIDWSAVERAAHLAQLGGLVSTLPLGLNTVIGERGVRLSGGQRQRIGIARALYCDPPVLILDEATSALDNVTEGAIMESIRQLAHRKTIVIIAHRLSTVQECDVIHLLEAGSVTASGSYDDLVAESPGFRALAAAAATAGNLP